MQHWNVRAQATDEHGHGGYASLPSHGFCASLDEAKAKFAETWRAWLASRR
jgi:hypothetical protein